MANLATRCRGDEGDDRFTIHTPLIHLTKAQIIRRGVELGVDYSHDAQLLRPGRAGRACGRCDSCLLRKKRFRRSGRPGSDNLFDMSHTARSAARPCTDRSSRRLHKPPLPAAQPALQLRARLRPDRAHVGDAAHHGGAGDRARAGPRRLYRLGQSAGRTHLLGQRGGRHRFAPRRLPLRAARRRRGAARPSPRRRPRAPAVLSGDTPSTSPPPPRPWAWCKGGSCGP